MLTSARDPEDLPGPASGPRDGLTDLTRRLGATRANVYELPQRVGTRKRVDPKQALRDMRIPEDVRKILISVLQQLKYTLDEMEVSPRFARQDVRQISVARGDHDIRHLLHIPAAVLRNDKNLVEFGHLEYMFSERARICIISPRLDNFPRMSFALIAKTWEDRGIAKVCFLNWSWLKEAVEPDPDTGKFVMLFEPPLGGGIESSSADGPPKKDRDYVASILTIMAAAEAAGSNSYFRDMVIKLELPINWEIGDIWTGNLDFDSRNLVEKVHSLDRYPDNERADLSVLGALIMELYKSRGDPPMRERFIRILRQYQLAPVEMIDQLRNE